MVKLNGTYLFRSRPGVDIRLSRENNSASSFKFSDESENVVYLITAWDFYLFGEIDQENDLMFLEGLRKPFSLKKI